MPQNEPFQWTQSASNACRLLSNRRQNHAPPWKRPENRLAHSKNKPSVSKTAKNNQKSHIYSCGQNNTSALGQIIKPK